KSDWKIEKNMFLWNITVPANTRATIYIPTKNAKSIKENGRPIKRNKNIEFLRLENDIAVYNVESGKYEILSENQVD
ncbi:MAG: alpha-L-rhamnosidase C-terminal domain-containing protein, partial [Bacteroidota bacterium]|nr:alpha-L-rhamnosidase C-terminal domain-containing protein [Bacteroidota bacterium]